VTLYAAFAARFRNPVRNLRDFQDGVYFFAESLQLAGAIQLRDPVTQIVIGQVLLPTS
jgi:hypothetical protein